MAVLLTGQPLTLWWVRRVLTGWPTPSIHQFEGVEAAFPPNSDYEAFTLGFSIKGKSVQQQLQVWRGVAPSPNQGTSLEASSLQWVPWLHPWWLPSQGVSWCWLGALRSGFFGWDYGGFLQKSYATECTLIREGDIALHLLPQLHYPPCKKAWFFSGRWVGLLCPELKSLGIGHHLILLEFLDILAGKARVGQQQETPLVKTQQCHWGLVIILYPVLFTHPLQESKRGPYLTCQFFVVIHSRNHN